MNNILELRGNRFIQAPKRNNNGRVIKMNSKKAVECNHIEKLKLKLEDIRDFWLSQSKFFEGILISVYYNKIVAKSNRINGLFKGENSNYSIVGAKFNKEKNKHIITYFLEMKDLEKSIKLLEKANSVLRESFSGKINQELLKDKEKMSKITATNFKTKFKQIIADVSYIDNFDVEMPTSEFKKSIITLYDTKSDTQELLKKIGIDILSSRILDKCTVFLNEDELKILHEKAPYLISMSTIDLLELSPEEFIKEGKEDLLFIPSPKNEPIIGVIDTLFDERVYFSEWVEFHDMISDDIPKQAEDYNHGTAVSHIIIDGPRFNRWLDDGCGKFRVRHFGVALSTNFSSFNIIRQIKEIILKNRDIKVWNISLGSSMEINDNFISAEAAILDQIQYENDVIFVIAGTNKTREDIIKIGSPADSINGIVVNSVTKSKLSTEYSRKGLALSFFAKPDISYYGGSKEEYIQVCEPLGLHKVAGTSFAAPWIARKLSYLIDILGLNREIAKTLIIDSARGWNQKPTPEEISVYGHGIVPIRIEDIIQTKDDEIRFLVSDISEKWNTYNYHFPVPIKDNAYPYIARATMCYFPMCNRTQGVDYTNTELNLKFGRMKNGEVQGINYDQQNQEEDLGVEAGELYEIIVRKNFRKWDNVKYISETLKNKNRPRKVYDNNNWGMEIKTNNRLDPKDGIGIRFGVVVTLKEVNGVNRIDEFIKNCNLSGWIVNELNINTRIELNQKMQEYIEFE